MSLSAERLDAIDAHHSPTIYDSRKICDRCGISWPCDRAAMVADLRAARAENEKLRAALDRAVVALRAHSHGLLLTSELARAAAVGLEEETEPDALGEAAGHA